MPVIRGGEFARLLVDSGLVVLMHLAVGQVDVGSYSGVGAACTNATLFSPPSSPRLSWT